jgi:hypothetical protein
MKKPNARQSLLRRLRARETRTFHFRIPSSKQLGPISTYTILNVGQVLSRISSPNYSFDCCLWPIAHAQLQPPSPSLQLLSSLRGQALKGQGSTDVHAHPIVHCCLAPFFSNGDYVSSHFHLTWSEKYNIVFTRHCSSSRKALTAL